MKMLVFALILSFFIFLGCTKADPEAYRSDPILQDYQSQLAATSAQIEGLQKQIESSKKELKDSVPQSGQATLHQRKLYDMEAKKEKLVQQVQFWKVRIESRAKEAQLEYLNSYKDKKEWPNKAKIESYRAEKRLRQARMSWDQKSRIEEYKKSSGNLGQTTQDSPKGGH